MTLRTLCALGAALLLAGCFIGSGGRASVCNARDETTLALPADADVQALRSLLAHHAWTVAPTSTESHLIDANKTWNGSIRLTAVAWRMGDQDGTNVTNYTMVQVVALATAHVKYEYSVTTLEAPLLADVRAMGAANDTRFTIPTQSAQNSWTCIHGD